MTSRTTLTRLVRMALAMLLAVALVPSVALAVIGISDPGALIPEVALRRDNPQPADPATPLSTPILDDSTIAWFGGYQWVIIGWDGTGVAPLADTATLLFADANTTRPAFSAFDASGTSNVYDGSDLQTAMNTTFYDTLPTKEKDFIVARDLTGGSGLFTTNWAWSFDTSSFDAAAGGVSATEYVEVYYLESTETFDWFSYDALRKAGSLAGNTYSGTYHPDNAAGTTATAQNVWPLSLAEASLLDETVREYRTESGGWTEWWLRSPGRSSLDAVVVSSDGDVRVSGIWVGNVYSVRGALHLNLSSVIFSSSASAASAKSAATVGDGLVEATTPTSPVKFTFLDPAIATPNVSVVPASNRTANLSFDYSDAPTGADQYLSATLLDGSGQVVFYGKLADNATLSSGTATLPVAGLPDGTYALNIFSEQANADDVSDFAGAPVSFELTVKDGIGTITGVPDVTWDITYENLQGATNTNPSTYVEGVGVPTLADPGSVEGLTFVGWFDALEGGTQVTSIGTDASEDVTLFARWSTAPSPPPTPDKPVVPATGDYTVATLGAIALLASLAAFVIALVIRKKGIARA